MKVGNLVAKLMLDGTQYKRAMKDAKKQNDKFKAASLKVGAAIAATGVAMFAAGRKAAQAAAEYESARITFSAFLGSATKAHEMLQKIEKFSMKTPFEPKQVQEAANTLLGFGLEAEKLMPTLRRLGDISRGNNAAFQRMAVTYGQARGEGRLMTKDIREFVNQGVPMIKLLSESLGVAEDAILGMASEGKIGFDVLEGAFKQATEEGGMFFNMMLKQSGTFNGLMSTMSGNVDLFFRKLGEYLLPVLKEAAILANEALTTLITAMGDSEATDGPKKFAAAFRGIAKVAIASFQIVRAELQAIFNKMNFYVADFLASTGNKIAGLAAAAGLTSVAKLFGDNASINREKASGFSQKYIAALNKQNALQKKYGKSGADLYYKEYTQTMERLLQATPPPLPGDTATPQGSGQASRNGIAMGLLPGRGLPSGIDFNQSGAIRGKNIFKMQKGRDSTDINTGTGGTKWERMTENATAFMDKHAEAIGAVTGGVQQLGDIWGAMLDNRMARLENYYTREKKFIMNSRMSEAAKAKAIEKLDKDVARKKAAIMRKQAKRDKAAAVFSAILNGAQAVLSALKFGPIAAAVVGGLAAIQTATILSAPIPKFARGGIVNKPTYGLVGEYPTASSDPEIIGRASTIASVVDKFIRGGGGNNGGEYRFRLHGQDLIAALEEASVHSSALGGAGVNFSR
jgi:tape measure domain-containing protein